MEEKIDDTFISGLVSFLDRENYHFAVDRLKKVDLDVNFTFLLQIMDKYSKFRRKIMNLDFSRQELGIFKNCVFELNDLVDSFDAPLRPSLIRVLYRSLGTLFVCYRKHKLHIDDKIFSTMFLLLEATDLQSLRLFDLTTVLNMLGRVVFDAKVSEFVLKNWFNDIITLINENHNRTTVLLELFKVLRMLLEVNYDYFITSPDLDACLSIYLVYSEQKNLENMLSIEVLRCLISSVVYNSDFFEKIIPRINNDKLLLMTCSLLMNHESRHMLEISSVFFEFLLQKLSFSRETKIILKILELIDVFNLVTMLSYAQYLRVAFVLVETITIVHQESEIEFLSYLLVNLAIRFTHRDLSVVMPDEMKDEVHKPLLSSYNCKKNIFPLIFQLLTTCFDFERTNTCMYYIVRCLLESGRTTVLEDIFSYWFDNVCFSLTLETLTQLVELLLECPVHEVENFGLLLVRNFVMFLNQHFNLQIFFDADITVNSLFFDLLTSIFTNNSEILELSMLFFQLLDSFFARFDIKLCIMVIQMLQKVLIPDNITKQLLPQISLFFFEDYTLMYRQFLLQLPSFRDATLTNAAAFEVLYDRPEELIIPLFFARPTLTMDQLKSTYRFSEDDIAMCYTFGDIYFKKLIMAKKNETFEFGQLLDRDDFFISLITYMYARPLSVHYADQEGLVSSFKKEIIENQPELMAQANEYWDSCFVGKNGSQPILEGIDVEILPYCLVLKEFFFEKKQILYLQSTVKLVNILIQSDHVNRLFFLKLLLQLLQFFNFDYFANCMPDIIEAFNFVIGLNKDAYLVETAKSMLNHRLLIEIVDSITDSNWKQLSYFFIRYNYFSAHSRQLVLHLVHMAVPNSTNLNTFISQLVETGGAVDIRLVESCKVLAPNVYVQLAARCFHGITTSDDAIEFSHLLAVNDNLLPVRLLAFFSFFSAETSFYINVNSLLSNIEDEYIAMNENFIYVHFPTAYHNLLAIDIVYEKGSGPIHNSAPTMQARALLYGNSNIRSVAAHVRELFLATNRYLVIPETFGPRGMIKGKSLRDGIAGSALSPQILSPSERVALYSLRGDASSLVFGDGEIESLDTITLLILARALIETEGECLERCISEIGSRYGIDIYDTEFDFRLALFCSRSVELILERGVALLVIDHASHLSDVVFMDASVLAGEATPNTIDEHIMKGKFTLLTRDGPTLTMRPTVSINGINRLLSFLLDDNVRFSKDIGLRLFSMFIDSVNSGAAQKDVFTLSLGFRALGVLLSKFVKDGTDVELYDSVYRFMCDVGPQTNITAFYLMLHTMSSSGIVTDLNALEYLLTLMAIDERLLKKMWHIKSPVYGSAFLSLFHEVDMGGALLDEVNDDFIKEVLTRMTAPSTVLTYRAALRFNTVPSLHFTDEEFVNKILTAVQGKNASVQSLLPISPFDVDIIFEDVLISIIELVLVHMDKQKVTSAVFESFLLKIVRFLFHDNLSHDGKLKVASLILSQREKIVQGSFCTKLETYCLDIKPNKAILEFLESLLDARVEFGIEQMAEDHAELIFLWIVRFLPETKSMQVCSRALKYLHRLFTKFRFSKQSPHFWINIYSVAISHFSQLSYDCHYIISYSEFLFYLSLFVSNIIHSFRNIKKFRKIQQLDDLLIIFLKKKLGINEYERKFNFFVFWMLSVISLCILVTLVRSDDEITELVDEFKIVIQAVNLNLPSAMKILVTPLLRLLKHYDDGVLRDMCETNTFVMEALGYLAEQV
ncbi:hypothetical protein PCE1_003797 [Barthelona sp. PCE]